MIEKIGSIIEKLPIIREFAGSLHICARWKADKNV
jgi:hypothetical protein